MNMLCFYNTKHVSNNWRLYRRKISSKKNDVTISKPLQREIIEKAEIILKLETKGIHVAFSNLSEFKKELLNKEW